LVGPLVCQSVCIVKHLPSIHVAVVQQVKLYTPSCPNGYSNNLVCSSGAGALAAPSPCGGSLVKASAPFSMLTSLEDLFAIFIYFYVLFSVLIDHSIVSPYGSITFPK